MADVHGTFVGVDGCRGGWLAVTARGLDGKRLAVADVTVWPDFKALLARHHGAAAVAVDMPIGLSSDGRRGADFAARLCLGPRRSSVFPPPPRCVLEALSWEEANALSRALCGRGLQRLTYNLLPKIRELEALVTTEMQDRVVEAHPELCFRALAGSCLQHAKRGAAGRDERRALLSSIYVNLRDMRPPPGAAWDDLYDACVLAWTARRVASGEAVRLPDVPERDERGLRMEIVY